MSIAISNSSDSCCFFFSLFVSVYVCWQVEEIESGAEKKNTLHTNKTYEWTSETRDSIVNSQNGNDSSGHFHERNITKQPNYHHFSCSISNRNSLTIDKIFVLWCFCWHYLGWHWIRRVLIHKHFVAQMIYHILMCVCVCCVMCMLVFVNGNKCALKQIK